MEKRILGRTGLEVSVLGVGGHVYPVGAAPGDFCTHDERAQLIRRLVEGGVNYFDTTWLNEVELLADSMRRAAIMAPVHVSLQYVDGISDAGWRHKLRREVEIRLEVMGLERAPLFIMGVGNNRPPLGEIRAACEALHALKAEGLIENIGVSCHELTAFDNLATVIEQTDLLDYMMIRYNWKFPQANERLFPIARAHNVGLAVMKVFCWDCGPDNWGRRISIFEPLDETHSTTPDATSNVLNAAVLNAAVLNAAVLNAAVLNAAVLNAAQRAWQWCVQTSGCATTVPAINATWEADELLQAAPHLETSAPVDDFAAYQDRLYDRAALTELSQRAHSTPIRQRAAALL